MKLPTVLIVFQAFAATCTAQYFSEGWSPGKDVSTAAAESFATYSPQPTALAGSRGQSWKDSFDLSNILSSPPIAGLFQMAGVNITEKLEIAKQRAKFWSDQVPLITDENFGELIVNETLTPEEEAERVWFLVITVTAQRQDAISKFVDQQFDLAYNLTQEAQDLPHVGWGRIDYLNVTTLTTKWAVWRAPQLVLLKDRGQTLYFYKAQFIRPKAEELREFLLNKTWEQHQPWSTAYAPGGSREWMMDYLAFMFKKTYNVVSSVPTWILMLLSGTAASFLVKIFHRKDALSQSPTVQVPPTTVAPPAEPVDGASTTQTTASSRGKHGTAKLRKSGKK